MQIKLVVVVVQCNICHNTQTYVFLVHYISPFKLLRIYWPCVGADQKDRSFWAKTEVDLTKETRASVKACGFSSCQWYVMPTDQHAQQNLSRTSKKRRIYKF